MPTTVPESVSATYYYAAGKKITINRRSDLVAVKFQSRATTETITSFGVRELQLEPSDEFKEMQQGALRLFKVPAGRESRDGRALREAMLEQPGVEKVGEVFTNEFNQPLILTRELVCRFKPGITVGQIDEILKTFALEKVEKLAFTDNGFVLGVKPESDRDAIEVANALVEQGYAVYAAPNFIEHIGLRQAAVAMPPVPVRHGVHPADPMFGQQWHLDNIGQVAGGVAGVAGADVHVTLAWQVTMGDSNLRLAVIDGGTDITHNDLNAPGKVVAPIDFDAVPPDNNPIGGAHGTQVAGMAVATANNGVVGAGAAPNCRLIPIKASDVGTQTQMAHGFAYAADNMASVITCSLGPVGPWVMQDHLREALDYATTFGRNGRGCVYTQAVDNAPNPINIDQVSAYERSIAVTRTNNRDLYDGAATGVELDLAAPGRDVLLITNTTAIDKSTSTVRTGTSYAAPLTAGVAVLTLSIDPGRSWEEVRQVLMDSADKIDAVAHPYAPAPVGRPPGTRNDHYGYGRVNAATAVQLAGIASQRDLMVRDTPADTGAVPQPAWGFWDSPDIWVRNVDDGGAVHQNTIRGQDNFVYFRVTNRGTEASLPCWVRVIITTFAGTEFRYPFDFKPDTTTAPAGGTPGNLKDSSLFPAAGSYLIGTQRIESIPAGGDVVAKVKWEKAFIPPAAGWHPCLLVEVSPHDGPMPAGEHVWENNNLGQKNITIVNAVRRRVVDMAFKYLDMFKHIRPFTSLELRWAKRPRTPFPVFLELKDEKALDKIKPGLMAERGELAEPETEFETVPETGGAEMLMPLKLTFLEEAKIAIGGEGRGDEMPVALTFPRGSSVEIGRGLLPETGEAMTITEEELDAGMSETEEILEEPGRAALTPIAAAKGFALAKLEGKTMVAMKPNMTSALLRVPSFGGGLKDAALKFRVPENARVGDTWVLDVAQRDMRGRLLGGVRFRINVVE